MLLGALPRELSAKVVMELDLDPGDPSTFKGGKLQKHVLDICATADALALLDSERARTVPGVSHYSIPAGVRLPHMPVVGNLPAIPNEETLAPAQAIEEIPIAKAENTIDTKMDKMMKAFEAWTLQLSIANGPRYGGSQTAGRTPSQLTIHLRTHQWTSHLRMHPRDPLNTDRDPITSNIHSKEQIPVSIVMSWDTSARSDPMCAPTRKEVSSTSMIVEDYP